MRPKSGSAVTALVASHNPDTEVLLFSSSSHARTNSEPSCRSSLVRELTNSVS